MENLYFFQILIILFWFCFITEGSVPCHVTVSVSSFWYQPSGNDALRGLQSRHLELNWEPSCEPLLYAVALLSQDPALTGRLSKDSSVLSRLLTSQHPEGYFRTNVSLGKPQLPGGWDRADVPQDVDEVSRRNSGCRKKPLSRAPCLQHTPQPQTGDHCLPFWAAGYDVNGTLLTTDCLKIRPTWMWDHRTELGSARLSQLMLPGTHNSGCYYKSDALARGDTISRFVLTQDEDIWEQLVWGIRYLDIRVGYYRDRGDVRLWINHGPVRITALQPILKDIRRFLLLSPGEVVIVDFHRFPIGFKSAFQHGAIRHRRLATMIRDELGSLAAKCTPNGSPKLNDLWASGRRLVVTHAERGEVHTNWPADWLCGSLTQAWGNQHSAAGLKTYLQNAVKKYSGGPKLWSAMAELTPSPLDPVLRPSRGLRLMADDVNRHVTRWFRDLWWRHANIVATDFMLGNKIVDVAIEANLRRRGIE